MQRQTAWAASRRFSCPRTWAGRRATALSGRCWSRRRFATSAIASRSSSPDTPEQARIAAELVEVDYEPLPAAVSVEDAAREGAPKVWDDNAAGNLAFPL